MTQLNPHNVSSDHRLLFALAAVAVFIHLSCSTGYGYFRDELYMIACSKHLAWGYVDQPPFSVAVLAVIGKALGYSQFALRVVPAFCGGLVALLVGLTTRQMGGRRFAQVLAVTAYLAGGVFLAISNYYAMNCLDHLLWAAAVYILIRILRGGDPRLWVLFGLVAGLGLENKYSMGFLGLGLIVGLALTPARKEFLNKWLWIGGALAALIFLPHVLWEVRNHFPTAEFIRNATLKKNLPMTPWAFLLECTLMVNPAALPLWLAGLVFLFRGGEWNVQEQRTSVQESERRARGSVNTYPSKAPNQELQTQLQEHRGSGTETGSSDVAVAFKDSALRPDRETGSEVSAFPFGLSSLAWIYVTVLAILLSTNSKPYYFAPAFLLLFPAGGVAVDRFLMKHNLPWLKPVYLSVLILGGILLAPLVLPVLAPKTLVRYQAWLGVKAGSGERGEKESQIPQFLGDRLGWPEMTAQVAAIYEQLSPEEKPECVIGASNYGEAGAIDLFGRKYGLPGAISTHNSYWFWGPGAKPGKVLLVIGGSASNYEELYQDVQRVGTFAYPYAPESGVSIFLCRRPKQTLQSYWTRHHDFI